MRTLSPASLVALVLSTGACSPVALYVPHDVPADGGAPLVVTSRADWPKAAVHIALDDLAIPHIYAQSQPDAAYALGLMHGRDRPFQIFAYVHAAEGRLSEVLGDDLIETDRENRLITFGIDEQLREGDARDAEMLAAYCAGVNEGARAVGQTAEMAILGVQWEMLTARDVIAVARLQQWDQSIGFRDEMARYRLVKALGKDSPVVRELLQDAPSGGVPIVSADELAGESSAGGDRAAVVDDVRALFSRGGMGASNSWSVAPAHTQSGHAVVANDPHLAHMAPGIFYMADIHVGADYVAAGGTFPGIPAVLIGHGRHIAWGVTNAYADTQDVVIIERDGDGYVVDGKHHAFGVWPQKFGAGGTHEEQWRTTIFGPVLPQGYGGMVDDDDTLALLWTAQQYPIDNGKLVSAFWDLAGSKDVDEATRAVQDFASPAMSVNMAFTDGTIAYRLSGIIPKRTSAERVDLPRRSGWSGRLTAAEKPHSENPKKGYIIATNQRVVENGVGAQAQVGFEGARPYRAMRIDTRLKALLADGKKASTDDLLAIQQDITALDAQVLAPIFAAHCPKHVDGYDDDVVARFCKAIGDFDGVFTPASIALPYARTAHAFLLAALSAHVSDALARELSYETFVQTTAQDLVVREAKGERTALLDDPKTKEREGLDGFTARAVAQALALVVDEAGDTDWHWGKLHTLAMRGLLARAPLIGGWFTTEGREEGGYDSTPRAEHPDYDHHMRVVDGAGLRLIAEMSDPPVVRMVNDSGQSGFFGSPHLDDQYPLWHDGKPRVLSRSEQDAAAGQTGAIEVRPRPR